MLFPACNSQERVDCGLKRGHPRSHYEQGDNGHSIARVEGESQRSYGASQESRDHDGLFAKSVHEEPRWN